MKDVECKENGFNMDCAVLSKKYKIAWLYGVLLGFYCLGMVVYSRYTFNLDDIWMWLNIYEGKAIFNGYNPESGRFFPLASLDLNLLMYFTNNPYVYFVFNAILVGYFGVLLWRILSIITGGGRLWLRIVLLCGFLFHPGFVTIMLGICYPERMQIIFLLVFVLASLRFYQVAKCRYAWLGFISANLALYYKEPTFLMIGCFGFVGLCIAYVRGLGRIACGYYASLVASASVYLGIYLVAIYPKITKIYQRVELSVREEWLAFARGIFNFTLNEVFLFVLLPSIVAYRIFLIVRKKSQIHILWDSLLLCSLLYVGAFLKLKLFENYYLLPVYIVSFGSMVYFLFIEGYVKIVFFRIVTIICMVVFLINTIPQGINVYSVLKSGGVKFHSAMQFIATQAKDVPTLYLYFDGNGDRKKFYDRSYWIYFDEYLKKIYDTHNVVVKFDITQAKKGDFILLNQSTSKMVDLQYLAQMGGKYQLVYVSEWFSLPYIGLKPLIKYLFNSQKIKDAVYGNENIFRLPLRDYIYKVP